MVRPRAFDETAVLDAAAAEFRVHGFADTSTEQLCEAAGVRRSSLYNTFESKDELFVRSLERYVQATGLAQEGVLLDSGRDGLARLVSLMDLVLDEEREAATHGHAAGCMVVGARMTPDLGAKSERVKSLLDHALEQQLALIGQAVRVGQLDGSIRRTMPAADAARAVVALISGMRVLAQAGSTPNELRQAVMLGLDGLRA
ncbi:AcrR family transcriptional regulator [Brevibacterium paucivorans]|uniref:AcrR family transcriptional regulator n=1 Tax=Brevibacterium paucivorans TaxID=170994 RepID=A0ABS2SHI7_9MICO|nr:TetR/AcrR family transcriptional regulator [Brevibacterium paucivorans]MBM7815712.1 AcrR family transcriptional regulator [Brevibacterium paucivorans]